MDPSPNREVALFTIALKMDASQRAVYLDKVCANDPALRQHLEALLLVHQKATTFLESPAAGDLPST
jgi:hypothetical protein